MSFKDNLQAKIVSGVCGWVEKKVSGKNAEEVMAFGHWLGRWAKRLPFKGKKDVLVSLKKVFPDRHDLEELHDKIVVEQTGRLLPDALLAFQKNSQETFPYDVTYHNMEGFDQKVAEGKGVVLVTGHFGNWEVFLQALNWKGYPMTVIQRQHHNIKLNQFITDKRTGNGAEAIDFHRRRPESFRQCLQALKKGRVVGVLTDVVPKTRSVETIFMGKKFEAPMGPALMAQMTGAPIFVGVTVRDGDSFRIELSDEITWSSDKPNRDDVPEMVGKIMSQLELFIRRYPDNWVWYLRRWRELPFID